MCLIFISLAFFHFECNLMGDDFRFLVLHLHHPHLSLKRKSQNKFDFFRNFLFLLLFFWCVINFPAFFGVRFFIFVSIQFAWCILDCIFCCSLNFYIPEYSLFNVPFWQYKKHFNNKWISGWKKVHLKWTKTFESYFRRQIHSILSWLLALITVRLIKFT